MAAAMCGVQVKQEVEEHCFEAEWISQVKEEPATTFQLKVEPGMFQLKVEEVTVEEDWKTQLVDTEAAEDTAVDKPDGGLHLIMFKCKLCNEMLTNGIALTWHMKSHLKERPLLCNVCYESFSSEDELTTHKSGHGQWNRYKCEFCNEQSSTADELIQHKSNHIINSSNIWCCFSCTLCNRLFDSPKKLNDHMRDHPGTPHHSCKTCGKSYAKEHILDYHVRKNHPGVVLHTCRTCKRPFRFKRALKKHLKKSHCH